jgi:hypothetical protein
VLRGWITLCKTCGIRLGKVGLDASGRSCRKQKGLVEVRGSHPSTKNLEGWGTRGQMFTKVVKGQTLIGDHMIDQWKGVDEIRQTDRYQGGHDKNGYFENDLNNYHIVFFPIIDQKPKQEKKK